MSRTDDLKLLRKNYPAAFVLASVIAERARYLPGIGPGGLQQGEAFIGDHDNYGLTEQQYRTAKRQLDEWCFATFKTTNKGTIAKLIDTRLFDVGNISPNDQNNVLVTGQTRTANVLATTNEEREEGKERKERKKRHSAPSSPFSSFNGKRNSENQIQEGNPNNF